MQNQVGATSTPNVIPTSNMVQLQTTKPQPQKFYTVDMSTYPHKLVSVPRPTSSYIALQPGAVPQLLQNNNNGQQFVQIQLPTAQQGTNFLNVQPQPAVSNIAQNHTFSSHEGQKFVRLSANFLSNNQQVQHVNNQQKVSIQLVQHPNQQQFAIKQRHVSQPGQQSATQNIQIKPNLQTFHLGDSLQMRPALLSPHKHNSLVGTVSVAQPTPMLQLTDLVQRGPNQQLDMHRPTTPQKLVPQQVTFIQASPMKIQPSAVPITSSSLFQAFQQAAQGTTPLNTPLVSRMPSTNIQTVLTTLRPQQLSMQPAKRNVAPQQHAGNAILLGGSANTVDGQAGPAVGFHGTIMMVSSNQTNTKQHLLAPKTTQANTPPVFVPITMANNVSVLTNQQGIVQNKNMTQLGPSTTLRIQQQIAPRVSHTVSNNDFSNLNTGTQQKIFIPVQSSSDQQQYIIQTIPQNIVQVSPQHATVKNQAHQKRDSGAAVPVSKPSKNPSTSSTALHAFHPAGWNASSLYIQSSITDSKPVKKPCNCTKSQCLKLYCECFANGEFCNNCNCRMCHNSIAHEVERSKAIKACLERNPYAFHPKIGKGKIKGDNERRHTKGCNCKRSGCLKNYCECYEAKILCSSLCKCSGCKNFEESSDRQTLMHLADAAEVRVQQQNAAKTKLAAQLSTTQRRITSKEKLPYTFMTADVSRATCDLLLASVQETDMLRLSDEESELCVLEEFSRSLNQIIEKSNDANTGQR